MMKNESISIPSSYFMKMAIIDYSNWKIALIREFFQNSIDAGATFIHCFMNEEERVLRVIDNGCGMTEDVIRNSLLTLGGSAKSSGAIGGLGKAKEILYFSWPTWEIRSNNIIVRGSGSSFSLQNDYNHIQGTSSAIQLPKEVVSYREIEEAIRYVVYHSTVDVKIYWNDALVQSEYPMIDLGQVIGDIPNLGKLHVNIGTSRSNEVVVQSRGLFMFSRYLPAQNRVNYCFNIETPSYDSLTSNRDGFIRNYRDQFDQLISKLTMNPTNMDYNSKIVIPVVDRKDSVTSEEKYDTCVLNMLKIPVALRNSSEFYNFSYITKNMIGFDFDAEKPSAICMRGRRIKEFYIQYSRMFANGFIVLAEKDKMDPAFFLRLLDPEVIAISKLWQRCVNTVNNLDNGDKSYIGGTGFITLPDIAAYNSNKWICINPFLLKGKPIEDIISQMMVYVCHELTHNTISDHNQDFISAEEEKLFRLLKSKSDFTEEEIFYNRFLKAANSLVFS